MVIANISRSTVDRLDYTKTSRSVLIDHDLDYLDHTEDLKVSANKSQLDLKVSGNISRITI